MTARVPQRTIDAAPLDARIAFFTNFTEDESGQDLIEYALLAGAMALTTISSLNGVASDISNSINLIQSGFSSATSDSENQATAPGSTSTPAPTSSPTPAPAPTTPSQPGGSTTGNGNTNPFGGNDSGQQGDQHDH